MNRKRLTRVAVLLVVCGGVACTQSSPPQPKIEDQNLVAARAVLEAQAIAWNRGDVAGYMEGYAKEDATTFVGAGGVTRGWQRVFDRYKSVYDTRDKMGTLTFTELEFTPLGDAHILGSGRWQLTLQAEKPRGRFTLIFRRTTVGWRIVYDHSSKES